MLEVIRRSVTLNEIHCWCSTLTSEGPRIFYIRYNKMYNLINITVPFDFHGFLWKNMSEGIFTLSDLVFLAAIDANTKMLKLPCEVS